MTNREDELETIRQLLIATANRTEKNDTSISRLTESMDHLTIRLDQLSIKVDQISVKVDQTTSNVDNLTATVNRLAADAVADRANADADRANADADRTAMFVILEQMATLQQENKQILEYLFGQRRNGSGDQPEL